MLTFTESKNEGERARAVNFIDLFSSPKYIFIVMELMQMDLHRYVKRQRPSLDQKHTRQVFKMCLDAVKMCHDRSMLHRDVKPENFLVNVDKSNHLIDLKLTDFGQCCYMDKELIRRDKFGTLGFVAPEALVGFKKIDYKIDTWSLGALLFYMITGKLPFYGNEL